MGSARWDMLIVGGAMALGVGYLALQLAFRAHAPSLAEALILAFRDVHDEPRLYELIADRRKGFDGDGGSPIGSPIAGPDHRPVRPTRLVPSARSTPHRRPGRRPARPSPRSLVS